MEPEIDPADLPLPSSIAPDEIRLPALDQMAPPAEPEPEGEE